MDLGFLPVWEGPAAATALEHQLNDIARNTAGFHRFGVNTLKPFTP